MFRWVLGDWRSIGFVALSTVLIYGSVVLGLRFGERRTLTEMTAYDFAVAIALGSIIGRTATSADPSYIKGVSAVATLLLCHHALSLARTHSAMVRRVVDRSPIELVRDGELAAPALIRAHMTEADLRMVLREHGVRDPGEVELVTLEPRGAFSVIPRRAQPSPRP